eukprot:TRINITY_DN66401_c0_g1_i7.p1 TRINITY_DN66401_c0_g1~~TRINITY_DN66401_c0_g1_i7.p1  ORF type:complete len:358 (+),score=22.04 TRINITY_DN66401_c0_g1_i7:558-1631(+)
MEEQKGKRKWLNSLEVDEKRRNGKFKVAKFYNFSSDPVDFSCDPFNATEVFPVDLSKGPDQFVVVDSDVDKFANRLRKLQPQDHYLFEAIGKQYKIIDNDTAASLIQKQSGDIRWHELKVRVDTWPPPSAVSPAALFLRFGYPTMKHFANQKALTANLQQDIESDMLQQAKLRGHWCISGDEDRVQYMVKRMVDAIILHEGYDTVRVKDEGNLPERGRVEILLAKEKRVLICMECKCPYTTRVDDVKDDTGHAVVQTLWELAQLVEASGKRCYAVLTTMDCWRFFSMDVAELRQMDVQASEVMRWREIDPNNQLGEAWGSYEDSRILRRTWTYKQVGNDTNKILETLNWVIHEVEAS